LLSITVFDPFKVQIKEEGDEKLAVRQFVVTERDNSTGKVTEII